ncbi:MAG: hypothetical protein IIC74_03920 [Bacteroidetes bacterium]|nr:hypothetical protein [Bacteroidota bacterium]
MGNTKQNYFFNKSLISASKSLSVGPAGGTSSSGALVLLYALTIKNINIK